MTTQIPAGFCGEHFAMHATQSHLVAVCTLPKGHEGPHDNLHVVNCGRGPHAVDLDDLTGARAVLAAVLPDVRRAALDDLLQRADDGIEFGPQGYLLLVRMVREVGDVP